LKVRQAKLGGEGSYLKDDISVEKIDSFSHSLGH